MFFEKIICISIILLLLSYYIYRYAKHSSKIAILNIALEVIAFTILILIYVNANDASVLLQSLVFVIGYVIPVIGVVAYKFNINYILECKIVFANILVLLNKKENAKIMYGSLANIYPKYRVYKALGDLCLNTNQLKKALECFEKAVLIKPRDLELYYKIAYIQYVQNNYDEAITILNNILKLNPSYMLAVNLLVNILIFKKDEYKKALKIYFDLLENDSSNANICYNIAAIYVKENQNKNAKKFLEQAIKYDKKLYDAHYLLGYIHFKSKEYDLAIQDLLIAVKGNDTYAKSYYLLAKVYALQNEKGKATNCLNLAIEKEEKFLNLMHSDNVFNQVKELADGLDKIEKLANENISSKQKDEFDINEFELMNVDDYTIYEKQEVLATTVKTNKPKSKKSKKKN